MAQRNLSKFLTNPSHLASRLDWKRASGTVLAMDVGGDRLGLAIASHPCHGESPLPLDPLPIQLEKRTGNQRALATSVIQDLRKIVTNYNVCGILVSWPLQKEGRCGAPCGKVLHTLDSLVEESSEIVNTKRPFCLWDDHHYVPTEDDWGRTPLYGEATTKTLHKASVEQYAHTCSSSVAVDVWNDYCKKHWPALCQDEDDDIWGRESDVSVSGY